MVEVPDCIRAAMQASHVPRRAGATGHVYYVVSAATKKSGRLGAVSLEVWQCEVLACAALPLKLPSPDVFSNIIALAQDRRSTTDAQTSVY